MGGFARWLRCRHLLRAVLGAADRGLSARRAHLEPLGHVHRRRRWQPTRRGRGRDQGARIVIRNFVLCALLAGFVGVLEAIRASTVTPDTAGAAETMFRAVSAAVIGGTLLAGGEGTVDRRSVRRPVPRGVARRPDTGGRQRRLPRLHPRASRSWSRCASTSTSAACGRGVVMAESGDDRGDVLRSSTCPSGSGRSRPCATSTSICARGRCWAARRQRRGQVDADEDHRRLPERPTTGARGQGRGGHLPRRRPRPVAGHRLRLPGPRAGQRARRGAEHVPQARAGLSAAPPAGQRRKMRRPTRGRRWTRSASTSRASTSRSRDSPVDSGRPSQWPAP